MQTFVEYQKRDLLIGAFLVVGLVFVLAAVFVKLQVRTGYYTVKAEFSRIATLNESAKVRLRGYEIGYVQQIRFFPMAIRPDVYFEVDLAIEDHYPLFEGTHATVRGGGIVGDRFVELDVPVESSIRLAPGSAIPGDLPDDIGETLETARDMMRKVGTMAKRFDNADVGGKFRKFVDHVKKIREGVDRIADSGSSAFRQINGAVADIRPGLVGSVSQLHESMDRLSAIMDSTDALMVDNKDEIEQTLSSLASSLQALEHLVVNVDSLTTGGRQDILKTIENLQDASHSLKDLSKHPWKFFTGKVE